MRFYTQEHEWIEVDGEQATVGITDYAQNQLGDIVFVELPEPDSAVEAGKEAAVVESVKAASDVFAPVSGIVTEINEQLADNPALVNTSAEGDGWFFRVRLSSKDGLTDLMDGDAYAKWVATLS